MSWWGVLAGGSVHRCSAVASAAVTASAPAPRALGQQGAGSTFSNWFRPLGAGGAYTECVLAWKLLAREGLGTETAISECWEQIRTRQLSSATCL